MENINITTTIKYTKDLTLLYAEDDIELQNNTKDLFESLFKSVTIANNGKIALEFYKENNYDIVISDIKMPEMNGIELVKEIKSINSNQSVVITSAYSDSNYLLEFINLNVSHFITKPVNSDSLIQILYTVSKNIVNTNMVELYRKDLESTNVALKEKNDELQSLVRILDSKIAQISKGQTTIDKDVNYDNLDIPIDDLEELKELETDISGASVLISLSKNINISNIKVLAEMFSSYSKIISEYDGYEELSFNINTLSQSLDSNPENFIQRVEDISILLESFIYVLRIWRKNLVDGEAKKAFELHASMVNDIATIISIIDGTEDDIEGEMEFF